MNGEPMTPQTPDTKVTRKKLARISVLRQEVLACIPSSWCDDLLTGPRGIKVPAGCPDIERLLNHLRADIEATFARHSR